MNIEEKINDLKKQIEDHNQLVNQQMLELQKLLSEQNNKVEETVKIKSVQELVIGERESDEHYYIIDNCFYDIKNYVNNFDHVDERLYESFNYFQNKNEAEKYFRLAYLNNKMIRIRNYVNNGWILENSYFSVITLCFNDKEKYFIMGNIVSGNISPLFFANVAKAQEFEKLVDKKELLEYLQLMEGYIPNA